MHVNPDPQSFRRLCQQGNVVPVTTDWIADLETPVSAYAKLKSDGPAFLLESIEGGENLSRYSFIGCRPRKIIRVEGARTRIRIQGHEDEWIDTPADPLTLIEEEMSRYQPVELPDMPRFMGGAVGFVGYEYIHHIEPSVPKAARDVLGTPLLYFMLADSLLVFDRARQTLRLCVNVHITPGIDPDQAYAAAVDELNSLQEVLNRDHGLTPARLPKATPVRPHPGNFTQPRFESMVENAKEFIRAGDIIQVVLSQRFERGFTRPPLDLYRALRTINPSPYMFLLEAEDFALVGASPEVHVRLTDQLVEIRPIAGTRPRGSNPDEDVRLEKELLADEKERAEHLMLVDLARNDIGRVCQYGTIHVPEYMAIERYSHVMHIVSQVEGRIADDRNAFDLLRATFPAGTVSGAPKIRAMQIIADEEKEQRGPYAGVLGNFGYNGNLDSCINLRTALIKGGKIFIQAGAGLVADSVPEAEFNETIFKASALFRAVDLAESL
ncbi:MAG: anthranilate synthase component I [Opitutaceae bacterium]